MKIAILGISIECNTFSPILAKHGDIMIYRGNELIDKDLWEVRGMIKRLKEDPQIVICPLLWATGLPAGPLERDLYESYKDESLRLLKEKGPFDGVLLAMHGAMAVDGLNRSADTDYILAIRKAIGPDVPLGLAFDLHGNLTKKIAEAGTVFSAFRTAPHRDDLETGYRVANQLIRVIHKGIKPKTHFIKIPILIAGEKAVTHYSPGRELYQSLYEYDKIPGVLQTILMVGFIWCDAEWAGMSVLVTCENDLSLARQICEEIAQKTWDSRNDYSFGMDTADIETGIEIVLKTRKKPIYLCDSGDNTTAGAAGDLTIVLQHLIMKGLKNAVVPGIYGPETVRKSREMGKGMIFDLILGSEHTTLKEKTMKVKALVEEIGEPFFQYGPNPGLEGSWVRLNINDNLVTFHDKRIGVCTLEHFQKLGIDPENHLVYIMKQGYLYPQLESIAKKNIMLLSPGTSDMNLENFSFLKISNPVFPFQKDMKWNPHSIIKTKKECS